MGKLGHHWVQVLSQYLPSEGVLLVPLPPPLFLNQTAALLWRPRSLERESRLIQIILVNGSSLTSRKMIEYLNGGESSVCLSPPITKTLVMFWSKEWPASKPWPSGCQPHKWNERAHGLPHPAWGCWGEGIFHPQKVSRDPGIIEWCRLKRLWLWPRLYSDVPSILECPQECSAELCRNCVGALPW